MFSVSKSAVITSPRAPKNEKKRPEIDEVDEFTLMKAKYFGEEKEKRKIRKMNDKKFVFDWDAEEDTSMDTMSTERRCMLIEYISLRLRAWRVEV